MIFQVEELENDEGFVQGVHAPADQVADDGEQVFVHPLHVSVWVEPAKRKGRREQGAGGARRTGAEQLILPVEFFEYRLPDAAVGW